MHGLIRVLRQQYLGATALHQLHEPTVPEALTSRWVVVAREARTLAALAADRRWRKAVIGPRPWTDDRSNLLDVISWRPPRPPANAEPSR